VPEVGLVLDDEDERTLSRGHVGDYHMRPWLSPRLRLIRVDTLPVTG
jgi:hypothetical protein